MLVWAILWRKQMSRLAGRFLVNISIVLASVIVLTLFINTKFMERYYLHVKKAQLANVCEEVEMQGNLDWGVVRNLERKHQVVIVQVPDTADNSLLNERLREAFIEKGLGLEKFWLWEEDYRSAMKYGGQMRIYNQGKLNYSLLVEYKKIGQEFLGIAMVIPNVSEMIRMINLGTGILFTLAFLLLLCLLFFMVRRVTMPLGQLAAMAKDMTRGVFPTAAIRTNDEVEALADSFNEMSRSLERAQDALKEKNRQMESLLSNVSHDLKTPISVIKAYTSGMRDGMDDGTFLDTVISQTEKLEQMTEKLLDLSRIGQRAPVLELFDVSILLNAILEEQALFMELRGIICHKEIVEQAEMFGDQEELAVLFRNLVTNAIKYSAGKEIQVFLTESDDELMFRITNKVSNRDDIDLVQIWEPFYVGESSRNQYLSGTGLGLAIVRAIAKQLGIGCSCKMIEDHICFKITMKRNGSHIDESLNK